MGKVLLRKQHLKVQVNGTFCNNNILFLNNNQLNRPPPQFLFFLMTTQPSVKLNSFIWLITIPSSSPSISVSVPVPPVSLRAGWAISTPPAFLLLPVLRGRGSHSLLFPVFAFSVSSVSALWWSWSGLWPLLARWASAPWPAALVFLGLLQQHWQYFSCGLHTCIHKHKQNNSHKKSTGTCAGMQVYEWMCVCGCMYACVCVCARVWACMHECLQHICDLLYHLWMGERSWSQLSGRVPDTIKRTWVLFLAGKFSSLGSAFCADSYFGIRSTPVTTVAGHSAKSASGRLQLNAHATYIFSFE